MRRTLGVILVLACAGSLVLVGGCLLDGSLTRTLASDAQRAPSSAAATQRLRAAGPAGLQALLVAHAPLIDACTGGAGCDETAWTPVRAVIEEVAQQRDAAVSGLYWYTDLGQATSVAAETGRPVLSLRLLGNLNEELTCANSRFFRTVLYANATISAVLREQFVLHWESVRPVPKLTVDFGGGRKLETTITGNSAHYLLTPDGQPVDALPGQYGSGAFTSWLERAGRLARRLGAMPVEQRATILAAHHRQRLVQLAHELAADLDQLRLGGMEPVEKGDRNGDDIVFQTGSFISWPEGTKADAELPIIQSLVPDAKAGDMLFDGPTWSALAALHEDEVLLDERSRRIARMKHSTGSGSASMEPMFERLQRSVAEEMVRNDYVFRRIIHGWFADGTAPADVDELNRKVYRDLFLLPESDAWLGLVPPDAYRALDDGGLDS